MDVIFSTTAAQIEALTSFAGIHCDTQNFVEQRADMHLALVDSSRITSCCSLWWSHTPAYQGERLGLIGHFNATWDGGVELLHAATTELQDRGCTLAVGPMDGSTWHNYRLVTDRGSEPPFLLEPQNPPEWPAQFEQAGFTPLAQYYSALNGDLSRQDPRGLRAEQRVGDFGIQIRSATAETLQRDLQQIYRISISAFANNFLYTPLSEPEFLEQYRRVLSYVNPRLVLMAEWNGDAVGFLFAIPDALQSQRGHAVDTAIVKTVAILPDPSLKGLGSLLVARAHRAAHDLGFKRCIHALMHESNTSLNISRHYAEPMRRYTLYSRSLRA
jgi:GNAT superfamily N-acetyltransferase